MFKKSMIIAGLLLTTTFGADISNEITAVPEVTAGRDLAWVNEEIMACSLLVGENYTRLSDVQEKAAAVSRMLVVFEALKANPMMTQSNPTRIGGIGNILVGLDAKKEAIEVYRFVLGLDPKVFGCSMGQDCWGLHKLGETELAINTLRQLINNSSIEAPVRQEIIKYFI